MTAFSLRARWVLPVDSPPIAGGYVAVSGQKIAAVGAGDPGVRPLEDLGDVVLMPGLVNVHTHLEFSHLSQPLGKPGVSVPEWIRLVIGERKRSDRDTALAIEKGLKESLAAGVTTIGEISTAPAAKYAGEVGPTTLLFQEAIGFSAARVDAVLSDVQRRLDEAPAPAGLSPHAPYTVHPRLVARLVQLAATRNAPVAMHLAESREELRLLASGDGPYRDLLHERSMWDSAAIPRGSCPLAYLQMLAAAPRALVIHGNYLTADEIEFVAARRERMSVVFCPRTHAYFGHEPYPLPAMRSAGVRVAVATDSRASNPDLNVLNELPLVAAAFPQVPVGDLVRMATLEAAAALGLEAMIGSLTSGKRADLIALPCDATVGDPYQAVLAASHPPRQVWLAGRRIV